MKQEQQARQQELFESLAELGRRRGHRGEDLAADWLQSQGFQILARNLRKRQTGEVDLLAQRGGVLHVVEVKTGRCTFAELAERVDERKLRLLLKTLAQAGWIEGGPQHAENCQLDLLMVRLTEHGPAFQLLEDICPPELHWQGGADVF